MVLAVVGVVLVVLGMVLVVRGVMLLVVLGMVLVVLWESSGGPGRGPAGTLFVRCNNTISS